MKPARRPPKMPKMPMAHMVGDGIVHLGTSKKPPKAKGHRKGR